MAPNRIDLLSFVLKNKAIVLVFANAELACKSWRSACNRLLAACRVWPKDPWACGLSAWVVPVESVAAIWLAKSVFWTRPELESLTLSPEASGGLGIGYR